LRKPEPYIGFITLVVVEEEEEEEED